MSHQFAPELQPFHAFLAALASVCSFREPAGFPTSKVRRSHFRHIRSCLVARCPCVPVEIYSVNPRAEIGVDTAESKRISRISRPRISRCKGCIIKVTNEKKKKIIKFTAKLWEARSPLYGSRFLRLNTH